MGGRLVALIHDFRPHMLITRVEIPGPIIGNSYGAGGSGNLPPLGTRSQAATCLPAVYENVRHLVSEMTPKSTAARPRVVM